ncbi:MAG: hypothetical protein U1E06_11280 [Tabrizicola sp.]|uniref:winged helix domain-containing protein n=1 Tax=Tabrizicola sp. TaxID=2005166 RepID=UPI0027368B7D|nr:hypothetical protein [Tabrizicola sp.]MDP3264221.1 hypothetical protein [Tabrizicola sp.]MDZ4067409.1 hypothetical protein [Tabrizicola sp.]
MSDDLNLPADLGGEMGSTTERPGLSCFLIEELGEPAHIVMLDERQARALARLAEAGPDGLTGGDPRVSAMVNDLRAAGIPIATKRTPQTDGGAGNIARYTVSCPVQRLEGGE